MSDYENAPATKMVATFCACCARPLVDATSVETGVGPECRKRHGFDKPDQEVGLEHACVVAGTFGETELGQTLLAKTTVREMANVLVHRVAVMQDGPSITLLVNAIRMLGYTKLANRCAQRLATVTIEEAADRFVIRTPYRPETVDAWRRIPGRRWDRDAKANTVPTSSRKELWSFLRANFHGATGAGPKGLFTIS